VGGARLNPPPPPGRASASSTAIDAEVERKSSNPLVTKFNFAMRRPKEKRKSDKGVNRRERKATKTLAIVMGK